MSIKTQTPETKELYRAILMLKNEEECRALFEDLCTVAEVQVMGKRLKAAKMLATGSKYADVVKTTRLSTATISRVNRALKYGSDGYTTILHRLGVITDETAANEEEQ